MRNRQNIQNKFLRASGLLLMLSGLTFWLGWILMPDAGTNDPVHILKLVAAHREQVWWSVIAHLVSSFSLMVGVIGIQTDRRMSRSKTTRVGASMVGLGAIGICLDAFFHLVAYYMTAPGVSLVAMAEPMRLLQTQGILFLIPLLISLIVGGTVYTAGFYHVDACSVWSKRVLLVGLAWALIGGFVASRLGTGHQIVTLGFLSWIALGYAWGGFEVAFRLRPDKSATEII